MVALAGVCDGLRAGNLDGATVDSTRRIQSAIRTDYARED